MIARRFQAAPAGYAAEVVEADDPDVARFVQGRTSAGGWPSLKPDGDERLVAASLAEGGFPVAHRLADGRTVWLSGEGKGWRHLTSAPKRRRAGR